MPGIIRPSVVLIAAPIQHTNKNKAALGNVAMERKHKVCMRQNKTTTPLFLQFVESDFYMYFAFLFLCFLYF